MSDKKLQPYPEINEAWKAVRSDLIKHPSGMEIARVVRVPTFGVYKRDLEKNAASIFMSEVEKIAVKVKEVDGGAVKVKHDMDFVEGGNSERYPFIPKDEVWVDKHLLEPGTVVHATGSCFDNICGKCHTDFVRRDSPIQAEVYTHVPHPANQDTIRSRP